MQRSTKGYLLVLAVGLAMLAWSGVGIEGRPGVMQGIGGVLIILIACWVRLHNEWTEEGDRKLQRMMNGPRGELKKQLDH